MEVKFIEPTVELIDSIASNMRQADVDEIWSSNHDTPVGALMNGWDISDRSVIVMVNNTPCVMLGLVIHDILTGTGVPWLLGTNDSLKYKRHFISQVPAIINEMLNICPILFNYVHVKNRVSISWLKRIGFSFNDASPYGRENELFYKFYLERT